MEEMITYTMGLILSGVTDKLKGIVGEKFKNLLNLDKKDNIEVLKETVKQLLENDKNIQKKIKKMMKSDTKVIFNTSSEKGIAIGQNYGNIIQN